MDRLLCTELAYWVKSQPWRQYVALVCVMNVMWFVMLLGVVVVIQSSCCQFHATWWLAV